MARRARFVILLVLFVSGAVIAGDNIVAPAATNNISESTLPDLGSESVLKEQHNNGAKLFAKSNYLLHAIVYRRVNVTVRKSTDQFICWRRGRS